MNKGKGDVEPPEGPILPDEKILEEMKWVADHIQDSVVPKPRPDELKKILEWIEAGE